MNSIYLLTGSFVFVIAVFRRDLLTKQKTFKLILAVSIAFFLTGVILHFTPVGRHSASGALLGPLLSLGWYRLCWTVFVKRFKREPKDTLFDWTSELKSDRPFNVVYFASTPFLVMLAAVVMMELARVGW